MQGRHGVGSTEKTQVFLIAVWHRELSGALAARVMDPFGAEYGGEMRRQPEVFSEENFDRA